MKTNITILSTKYKYVDSRAICVIRFRIKPIIINNHNIQFNIFKKYEYIVVGKAYCHPNDTYEYSIGRKIAESRAKKALFKFLYNTYNKYWDTINSRLNLIDQLSSKCRYLVDQEIKHINKLLDDTK